MPGPTDDENEIAALLGIPKEEREFTQAVAHAIDRQLRIYLRTLKIRDSDTAKGHRRPRRASKRHPGDRQALKLIHRKIAAITTAYAGLNKDAARKWNHRAAKQLGWQGERTDRSIIGHRLVFGFLRAMSDSILDALKSLNKPRGKPSKQTALNVLMEALGRIWCATTEKPFSFSDKKGNTRQSKARFFVDQILELANVKLEPADVSRAMKTVQKYNLMPEDERDASDETRVEQFQRRIRLRGKKEITIRI